MSGKKILIVDDDQEVLAFLRTYLEAHGYDVFMAASAKDGMRLAGQTPPDLVILDVMMPDAGGLTAYKKLRECKGANNPVPVLIFSAAPSFLIKSDELRKEDVIPKAEKIEALLAAIRQRLGEG